MTRLFHHSATVRICVLVAAILIQTLCAAHANGFTETRPTAPAMGCHHEAPATPAPPAKCCVLQDMLKDSLPAPVSFQVSPMVLGNAFTANFLSAAAVLRSAAPRSVSNGCPPAFSILRI